MTQITVPFSCKTYHNCEWLVQITFPFGSSIYHNYKRHIDHTTVPFGCTMIINDLLFK